MAGKCSRNGLKVGVRSYYSVGRPPAKFHRIRSPFDAPTDNYSGSIPGLIVGRFRSPEIVPGCISPLFSQTNPLSTVHIGLAYPSLRRAFTPHARPTTVPHPTRTVVTVGFGSSPNVYKTSVFFFLVSLAYLSGIVRLRSEGPYAPNSNPPTIYI